ncbi:sucrose phosphorylase [Demequina muriae]|uniref:Sucrose phosphorylase n=1 Tax=Demequina muriae TaxID=3051664 RepID=A0ABT8GGK1_9MICO|nr:sucrose phosphorylase [Demequina sp. EGI L300058]MDN4480557.1 sucrose phosphorylase [Demequina sp. EGI L300058]
MKPVTNTPMLITYADSLGGNLTTLDKVLSSHFEGAFGGVHVLPFFPSSGDRGFAVIDYETVDPAFGDWDDVRQLGDKYYLMADFMINHVSVRSAEFRDYMNRGTESPYKEMFIHWDEFWPDGSPTEEQMDALYRRKAQGPFKEFTRADGRTVRLWNTFFEEQVDIDPFAAPTRAYFERNLDRLAELFPLIRFDAFAYASKRPGTSCFFVEPEVWDVLDVGMEPLREHGAEMLPEIHENYTVQLKMAERGHWVYDFALPMLMLHAIFTGSTDRLRNWAAICPRKQFTTLDTHDGIGVVDVAGLLNDDEVDVVRERVNARIAPLMEFVKMPPGLIKKGTEGSKQYQLMSSFYSALGEDDRAMLLARTVQLFWPGTPQVYYVGLLHGPNDVDALKASGEPRSVNRHDYSMEEIAERVVYEPIALTLDILRFRSTFAAFTGEVEVLNGDTSAELVLRWSTEEASSTLHANFSSLEFTVTARDADGERQVFAS